MRMERLSKQLEKAHYYAKTYKVCCRTRGFHFLFPLIGGVFYRKKRDFMDIDIMRKYLHDLSNALNAAKINAYLLRRMHGESLDKETIDGLDTSLHDAEQLVSEFHRRVHVEMTESKPPAHAAKLHTV
jgi:hypothetical protein